LKKLVFWAANMSQPLSVIFIFFILPEPVSSSWLRRGTGNGDCVFSYGI
jgi:hypothetical protein